MRTTLRNRIGLALLALAPAAGAQQGEPHVTVALATPLVRLGGTVRLDVVVEHTDDAQLLVPLPEVEGLILSDPLGPSTTQAIEIAGGRAVRRITVEWVVRVRPTRAGEFSIPPLRLRVGGEEVSAPERPMTLRVVEDSAGAEMGFLEIEAPRRVFEGQPFTVRARFGFDQDQPVGRHGLFLPWWRAQRGVIELERTPLDRGRDRILINEREEADIHPLDRSQQRGTLMRPFELRRRYLASRPGDLQFDASTYQFSVLLSRGRGFSPDEWQDYYSQAQPFTIEVVPVPEQGRPFEWSGAVGPVEASRRVDRRDLDEGDTLSLTVVWTGEANLQFFEPPDLSRLDAFKGYRVVGTTDEAFADERRLRYDLVPASAELQEIPAVPLWTFDPDGERYVLVETRPVPIRVRPVEGDVIGFEGTAAPEVVDLADLHTRPVTGGAAAGPGDGLLWWTGLGLPLGWLVLHSAVRRRSGDPDGPAARRRRAARRRLARELGHAPTASAQATALARFLAARTGEGEGAWIGRDAASWAEERQPDALPPGLIEELVALGRELDQRAWAAGDDPLDPRRVLGLADRLARGGLA